MTLPPLKSLPDKPNLRIDQVARFLDVSLAHVYRLVNNVDS